jgi:outer membrane protein OmpA-like peptidoglycan-associated protein
MGPSDYVEPADDEYEPEAKYEAEAEYEAEPEAEYAERGEYEAEYAEHELDHADPVGLEEPGEPEFLIDDAAGDDGFDTPEPLVAFEPLTDGTPEPEAPPEPDDDDTESAGFVVVDPLPSAELDGEELEDFEIVESSEALLHDAIQQNPGAAEPSIQHRDPEPFDDDGLDLIDAQYEESIRQADHVEFQQPAPSLPPAVHYDPAEAQLAHNHLAEQPSLPLHEVEAIAQETGNQQLAYAQTAPPRRWPAFVVATVIGASLGVIGALALFQVFRPDPTEVATPAPAPPVVTIVVTEPNTSVAEQDEDPRPGLAGLAAAGRFELNTIHFVPGTVDLTEDSEAILAEAAAAIVDQAPSPLSIDIRTFSELTSAANRDLSERQGQSILDHLTSLGVSSDSIKVNPLGAAAFAPAQPVQSFVVPSAGLDASPLRDAIEQLSPFAIGLDPVTSQLRPESLPPLDLLGEAMMADESTSLSLAAYSYSGAGADRNEEAASVAAEAAAAFLVTNHDIDRTRISILTPGETPYVVGADVGNHIFLKWGDGARVVQDVQASNLDTIVFAPGSTRLTEEIVAALDQLLAVALDNESTLIIAVHTATESSDAANESLGVLQAQAVVQYLVSGGMDEQRVRAYGAGALRQFDGQDVPSAVVVTALP